MSNADPADPGDDQLGPIDYLAVEFPNGRIGAEGFQALLDIVDRQVIRVLDLEFIAKRADGAVGLVGLADLEMPAGVDLTAWRGASSGLLGRSDMDAIGSAIQPGSVAGVVIYENLWVLTLFDAWRRAGARLVADGGIPAEDVLAALDVAEATSPRATA
jgi:hypothetical protein